MDEELTAGLAPIDSPSSLEEASDELAMARFLAGLFGILSACFGYYAGGALYAQISEGLPFSNRALTMHVVLLIALACLYVVYRQVKWYVINRAFITEARRLTREIRRFNEGSGVVRSSNVSADELRALPVVQGLLQRRVSLQQQIDTAVRMRRLQRLVGVFGAEAVQRALTFVPESFPAIGTRGTENAPDATALPKTSATAEPLSDADWELTCSMLDGGTEADEPPAEAAEPSTVRVVDKNGVLLPSDADVAEFAANADQRDYLREPYYARSELIRRAYGNAYAAWWERQLLPRDETLSPSPNEAGLNALRKPALQQAALSFLLMTLGALLFAYGALPSSKHLGGGVVILGLWAAYACWRNAYWTVRGADRALIPELRRTLRRLASYAKKQRQLYSDMREYPVNEPVIAGLADQLRAESVGVAAERAALNSRVFNAQLRVKLPR